MKNQIFLAIALAMLSCQAQNQHTSEDNAPAEAAPAKTQPPTTLLPPNSLLHKASTRGASSTNWLLSKHTFSFNNYYDPDRMNFGLLRVLNDDWVAGGGGFPMHPHQNMEIISIPLEGGLQHEDNSGGKGTIVKNEVQIMSAGTGIRHSEFNLSKEDPVRFLQIWVFPWQQGLKPRYDQKRFDPKERRNKWQTIVSPTDESAVNIQQNAVFTRGDLDEGKKLEYALQFPGNGVYAFVLEGSATLNGQPVERRDGFGVWNIDKIEVEATENLQLLLMEVPMIGR